MASAHHERALRSYEIERGDYTVRTLRKLLIIGVAASFTVTTIGASASADSTLDKKQYLKAGNRICKATAREFAAVFEDYVAVGGSDQLSAEQIEEIVGREVPIYRAEFDEIEALRGPRSLEKKVGVLLDKYRDVVDDVASDPTILSGSDPFAPLNKKMKRLGLKACV